MNQSDLISALEKEMADDVAAIDVPAEEKRIDLEMVREWYFEAEQVLGLVGNLLSVPMYQAINQLRYAGHYALRAGTDPFVSRQNHVEALKHCKRALYDALDFYVFTKSVRCVGMWLPISTATKQDNLRDCMGTKPLIWRLKNLKN
jgi:hypothetical protein